MQLSVRKAQPDGPYGTRRLLPFKINRRKLTETLTAYTFLAPYLFVLIVFTLIAIVTALTLSFFYVDFGFTAPIFYGFRNYLNIWYDLTHDGDFAVGLRNCVEYTIGVVTLQTILALFLALLLNQRVRGRSFFRTIFYLPAMTSSVAISLIFYWLYQPQGGINYVLSLLHIQGPAWLENPSTALPAIMLLNIWTTAPTFMLMYLAALQDIPSTLYEAARVDGANSWQMLWKITVPLLRPTTFAVVALGSIGAFQMFDQAFVMEGASGAPLRSTLTAAMVIYDTAFQKSLMGLACAQAFVLFIIIFAVTLLQKRYIDVNIQY
ncbi:carbohydrate ABC transporter permease [Thermogemmatispora sp.]|uniref:carbohydrate ABC transporter permease n=1 Tax=Thermogemmatispora sp. TaxID=1968838 RepID=UPI001D69EF7B|nr:sugar ABC transporter permease [Thermogemmatispora sp.]MBX5450024.1 sugar ABC transporter permease [Thermogemmatispora sp.]